MNLIEWYISGFPGGSDSKESACNMKDSGSIPGLEDLENSMDRGYSLWGHKDFILQIKFGTRPGII